MHWNEFVFLMALGLGVAFSVAGRFVTRLNLRKGVPPFGRYTPVLDVAVHPEKYMIARIVPLVRILNIVGALALLVALLALASELFRMI